MTPAKVFSSQWAAVPGKFRVALYRGDFAATPIRYSPAASFEHRTLKAAARRLASLIYQGHRHGYKGPQYHCLYIVTPEGERLPLREAQRRIASNG